MAAVDLLLVPTRGEASGLFPDDEIVDHLDGTIVRINERSVRLVIGGFGLAAAAARASAALAHHEPNRVILAGLAGSYDPQLWPLGEVVMATRVDVDGIGAGEGEAHVSATEMGFFPRPGVPAGPLSLSDAGPKELLRGEILSVAAACANDAERMRRRQRHPRAMAEEMEGYSVALAALEFETPCLVLRALSNRVGERDPSKWIIGPALDQLRSTLGKLDS